jgi:hypothetical protein
MKSLRSAGGYAMANMFEDMMKGLDEVDAILAEETNSQAPENQPLLNQEVVDRAAKAETSEPKHSIMEFRGLGAEIWEGIDAQEYVNRERDSWDE